MPLGAYYQSIGREICRGGAVNVHGETTRSRASRCRAATCADPRSSNANRQSEGLLRLWNQELARQCGITNAGLPYYFGSKEGLLIALLEDRDQRDAAAVHSIAALTGQEFQGNVSIETLFKVLHAIVARNSTQPEFVRLFAVLRAETLNQSHPARQYFMEREIAVLNAFGRMVAPHVAQPRATARQLLAVMSGLEDQWLRADHGFDLVAEWERGVGGSSAVTILEAPIYAAAADFGPPVAAPYVVQLENVSLAELMKMPAAWAVVIEHIPSLKLITATPMLKPHLGNMTVYSLTAFTKVGTPEVLADIDRDRDLALRQGIGRVTSHAPPLLDRRQVLLTAASAATLWLTSFPSDEAAAARATVKPGRSQPFDLDWRFYLGAGEGFESPDFNDSAWRAIDVPHDWSIENLPAPAESQEAVVGPFDHAAKGGTAIGFSVGGEGWYRKRFHLPSPVRGRVEIQFDGIYMNSDVRLNGHHLGAHSYGYTPFAYDLTPYLSGNGDNILAVRVRNLGQNSRWYSGSGIYRHVWLDVLPEQARIVRWGVTSYASNCRLTRRYRYYCASRRPWQWNVPRFAYKGRTRAHGERSLDVCRQRKSNRP